MEKRRESYDVVIIGGGAAGLTAAIYCGRARLNTIVLEKSLPGGLATYTSEIENYPGFPETLSGPDLMKLFEKQAKKFGVKIKLTQVDQVELDRDPKIVVTPRVDYEAKAVVVASGGKPRLTGAKNEEKFLFGRGLSFCATCDAARYAGKTILVVGSGDAAIEEALFLSKFAKKIYLSVVHDVGIMDANQVAQERARQCPQFEFVWNTVVDEYVGDEEVETVILRNLKTGERIPLPVDGCFLFIGYLPNSELFRGVLDMTPQGYILTDDAMRTNVEGVFAAGDVREKYLRQVATSVGDGAIAGVAAERYIAESECIRQEILGNSLPTLVYFWNAADTDSRDFLRVVEELEAEYRGRLHVRKVDVYKSTGIARKLGVTRAPAVAFVRSGRVSQIKEGSEAMDADSLRRQVSAFVAPTDGLAAAGAE
ncbi:MAG TPA: FAD-dependent oxidoreductase [Firmicutes bacterium]|nr:FAD-dependent oxidoreductase [Bacillota bacterium]